MNYVTDTSPIYSMHVLYFLLYTSYVVCCAPISIHIMFLYGTNINTELTLCSVHKQPQRWTIKSRLTITMVSQPPFVGWVGLNVNLLTITNTITKNPR